MPSADRQWKQAFAQLDPEKQQAVNAWLNTQMFIARELGLEPERWFDYVEWAFAHPFDFEFAFEAGELARSNAGGDSLDSGKRSAQAAASVGSKMQTKLPGGGGPGNFLNMVAAGKKDRDGK